jgi:molybdate transport system substrate-binding protein
MKRIGTSLGIAAILIMLMAGAAGAEEIIVSAAASLTNAMTAVKQKFEAGHPGVKVTTNFGSSGALLKQMEQGAPVDVFCSADQKTMDQAAEKGLIDTATRKNFVKNSVLLVVPAGSKLGLKDEKGLSGDAVKRIALGNPDTVPAGRYTKEFLATAGLWEPLKPKYIMGENVRQVLDYVVRGEVDAGFVFATDAFQAGMKVLVVKEAEIKTPPLYPVAVVKASKKAAAKAFAEYLLGPDAQGTLRTFGFMKP